MGSCLAFIWIVCIIKKDKIMDNKVILGHIFIAIGEQLCDNKSRLHNSVVLSNEQMESLLRMLKIASSPQTHVLYIGDLAMRYGVTDRTIRNWIKAGAIPHGKMHDSGDNREYWLSHDLFKVDRYLVKKGYVDKNDITLIDDRLKTLISNFS